MSYFTCLAIIAFGSVAAALISYKLGLSFGFTDGWYACNEQKEYVASLEPMVKNFDPIEIPSEKELADCYRILSDEELEVHLDAIETAVKERAYPSSLRTKP